MYYLVGVFRISNIGLIIFLFNVVKVWIINFGFILLVWSNYCMKFNGYYIGLKVKSDFIIVFLRIYGV